MVVVTLRKQSCFDAFEGYASAAGENNHRVCYLRAAFKAAIVLFSRNKPFCQNLNHI